ncbi:MAG TPA: cytochrome c3 family protein, partial [Coriobacteriia bacterium]
TTLAWSDAPALLNASGAGSWLAYANADPPAHAGAGYWNSGTIQTGNITAPAPFVHWGTLTYDANVPAGTGFTVKIQGSTNGGTTWSDLATATASPYDLSAISATYTTLRLVGQFTSPGAADTPVLADWSVTGIKTVFQQTGSLACVSCHNAHDVQKGTAGTVWQVARSSAPTNTENVSANITDFCLGCHNLTVPSQGISASSLVPYTIGFRTFDALTGPFFTGWDKASGAIGFRASGHFATTGTKALCENCHDPHGSGNARLTAWTKPASFAAGIAGTRDNTSTNAAESNLCFQCHGNSGVAIGGFTGRTATGANGVDMDIATPLNTTSGHLAGITVTGLHKDTEAGIDLGAGKRHAECVDCHDPHAARAGVHTTGTAEGAPVVYGVVGAKPTWSASNWGGTTGYTPIRLDGTTGDYEAYLCFKCHSSNVAPTAGASTLAGIPSPSDPVTIPAETNIAWEFNSNNFSGHNVVGDVFTKQVASGGFTWGKPTSATLGLLTANGWGVDSAMTCSDCHNYSGVGAGGPHGSANPFLLKWGGAGKWYDNTLSTSAWSSSTNFCGGCHTGTGTHPWLGQAGEHAQKCKHCHIAIPHGWKRPRLLRGQDEYQLKNSPYVAPDASTWGDSWRGVTLMNITDQVPSIEANCGDSCDTGKHPITKTTW